MKRSLVTLLGCVWIAVAASADEPKPLAPSQMENWPSSVSPNKNKAPRESGQIWACWPAGSCGDGSPLSSLGCKPGDHWLAGCGWVPASLQQQTHGNAQ